MDIDDFEVLIDRLEDAVTTAKHIPMTSQVIIPEQTIFELVDEMRKALPEELKQARWILKEKEEIKREGQRESDRMLEEARAQAESLIQETEIVKQAEERSRQMRDEALQESKRIRLETEDWCDEMLAQLEVNLGKTMTAVQRSRDRLGGRTER